MFKEKNFLAELNQNEQLSKAEEQAIEELRVKSEPRLKEKEFSNIYSAKEIRDDLESVRKQETQHNVLTERGQLLEEILSRQIYYACWLGDDCETVQTTKYDDYVNHTDFIVEWGDNEEIKLAIDTTVTTDMEIIEKKFIKIQHELDKEQGTTIKYFKSGLDQPEGQLENVPRVIIAVDHDNLKKICEIMVGEDGKKKLGKSTLQINILEDIISQLETQIKYLEKKLDKGSELDVYENIQATKEHLEKILQDKQESPEIEKTGSIRNEPIAERERTILAAA